MVCVPVLGSHNARGKGTGTNSCAPDAVKHAFHQGSSTLQVMNGMEDVAGSFPASRSQTRFSSPVLGDGTSRGSLPIMTSRRLIRPSKWKTSIRNQSLNIAGTRWTIRPGSPSPETVIIPNRNSGALVVLIPGCVLGLYLSHTPLPVHLTHGHHGALAEEMASRLPT